MILLCGIPSEPPVRMVADAAARLGVETLLLNPRDAARTDIALRIRPDGVSAVHHGPGGAADLARATGAFVRLMDFRRLPEYERPAAEPDRTRRRIEAWHAMLCDWLESAPCRVMNRLRPSGSNMSKPYQARLIAAAGLATPRTLVTSDPDRLAAFRGCVGRVVFKSISAHRSVVKELTDRDAARLDRLRWLPVQFQELIEGDDVRVHVVGDEIFATRIVSAAVDYRYAAEEGADARYEPATLPDGIAERCRALSRALRLPLCGIDFKRRPDGAYVCLEANPAPAFSAFEERTGQPVAEAIVRTLAAPPV